jgi:hypothetical protein
MSFTDQEKTDIRRFTGFGMFGNQATPNFGARFSTIYGLLEFKMINMLPTEETVVRNVYLANLYVLEAAIPTTSDNLDTLQAAVWHWNKNEQRDRENLFRSWRLKLCGFFGIPAGPDLCSDDGRNVPVYI